jgi:hypothetical protein
VMETTRGPRHASKRLISWASIIEPNTLEQARTASQMPFILPHLALMPDAHLGKGATVGSVIPTLGAIIPAAVGVDIGCGTIAVRTQFTAEDFRRMPFADEAGVSDAVAEQVAAKLSDPDEVALSRQFPYRFVSAFEAAPSLRWGYALDKAIELATAKVPAFAGRTLVLVDTSASMSQQAFSRRSTMTPLHAAAVFGVVMAKRGNAVDLHGFADGVFEHKVKQSTSVLTGRAVHPPGRRGRSRNAHRGGAARDVPAPRPGGDRVGHADVRGHPTAAGSRRALHLGRNRLGAGERAGLRVQPRRLPRYGPSGRARQPARVRRTERRDVHDAEPARGAHLDRLAVLEGWGSSERATPNINQRNRLRSASPIDDSCQR